MTDPPPQSDDRPPSDHWPDRDPFYDESAPPRPPSGPPAPPQPPGDWQDEPDEDAEAALRRRGELIWQWYRVFAACMAVVCFLSLLTGISTLTDPHALPQVVAYQQVVSGWTMILVSAIGIVAYALAPILLPETTWAWAIHLLLIALAAMTCCCTPAALPLLVMWPTPAVRTLFSDG